MTFRIDAKHIGLTYPQCDLTRERVLESLRSLVGNKYRGAIIAQEKHADGGFHIHAYLCLSRPRNFRDASLFDIDGFHPNIQGLRSPKHWVLYVQKEDTAPLVDGNVETLLGSAPPKQRVSDAIAARLDAGATRDEIYAEFPGFYLMNKRKVDEMCEWIVAKRLNTGKKDWSECLARLIDARQQPMEPETQIELAEWLIDNVKTERKLRQKQLWLTGPPGCGKTTLVMNLEKYLRVYWVPMDCGGFFDGFSDDYDLIVFDEMKSQFKLTLLNQMICGGPIRLNLKGASTLKTRNIPCIFLSNYGPCLAYKTQSPQLEAFLDRITVIHSTSLHQLNDFVTASPNGPMPVATSATPTGPDD
jgi:hypothetical protein